MSVWFGTIGLIILGFLLILIEIFLVPGFNIFGVIGFISIVAGIIAAYSTLTIWYAHLILIGSLFASIVLIRVLVRSRTWKKLVLETEQSREQGIEVQDVAYKKLIGKQGISYTMLRPAGTAILDGKKYDVVTEGGFIERNKKIEVIKVEGNRIVVRSVI